MAAAAAGAVRSALIVASHDYADPKLRKLRAPTRDAEALAGVLADPGIGAFDINVSVDEPEYAVRRKLASFFKDRGRDDLLLLHFSCHGLKDEDGNLYFATPDTELEHLDATAVSSEFVNRLMNRSLSRRIVLLLDCCYAGAFGKGATSRAGGGVELKERFDGRGRVVLTASNSMEYAFEGDELTGQGEPSVFTSALVQGLGSGEADRDGDGRVSVDELYDYVYERVRETTPNQTPSKWTFDVQGDLVVARSPAGVVAKPAELHVELRQAIDSPLAGVRGGAVSELAELLRGANRGLAEAARIELERLVEDDSRRVSAEARAALDRAQARPAREPPAVSPPKPRPTVAPHRARREWRPAFARLGPSGIAVIAVVAFLLLLTSGLGGSALNRHGTLIIGAALLVGAAVATLFLPLRSAAAAAVVALGLQQASGAIGTAAEDAFFDQFRSTRHGLLIASAVALTLAAALAAATARDLIPPPSDFRPSRAAAALASLAALTAFAPFVFPVMSESGTEYSISDLGTRALLFDPVAIATASIIGVLLIRLADPRVAAGWLVATAANTLLYVSGLAAAASPDFGKEIALGSATLFGTAALLAAAAAVAAWTGLRAGPEPRKS